jgi:hypothetical protein
MSEFYFGEDLGQSADYTAYCLLRRVDPNMNMRSAENQARHDILVQSGQIEETPRVPIEWHIEALDRFELGTSYTLIAKETAKLLKTENDMQLVIDYGGPGRPMYNLYASDLRVYPPPVSIGITGGDEVTETETGFNVPSRDLFSLMRLMLETHRLKGNPTLKFWEVLLHELNSFKRRFTPKGQDTYGNDPREAPHDDLAFSLGITLWLADHNEYNGNWGNLL